MIPTVTVTADKNPEYDTDPGKNTKDKIFLLSINEANRYFSSYTDRHCGASTYAKKQGAYVSSNGNPDWWLRSPGASQYSAAIVAAGVVVYDFGYNVDDSGCVVRPTLWIEFE